jgi:hypothetical protein
VWQLLAENGESVALTGGAGWAGAGLLGLVMMWLLMKHLPDLAKERKDTSDSRDKIIQGIVTVHAQSLEKERQEFLIALAESRKEFREWLSVIAANDAAGLKALTDAVSREIVALQKAIDSMKDR